MPAYVEICWGPKIVWKGRELTLERRCRKIPLYVEIEELPGKPVPPPWEKFVEEFIPQFDGATVGPGLRDLGRTVFLLQTVDGIEDPDLRGPLQEQLAATVHELAREVVPDAEITIDFERGREPLPF